jgi:RNA polymerase sigma factor (sigma-70 family)
MTCDGSAHGRPPRNGAILRAMDRDTGIGGPARAFPPTRHSVLAAAVCGDEAERRRAAEALIAAYWKPAYVYVRLHWRASNEDAKDLVQSFFTRALEKSFFAAFDPSRARFRTFLRTCLDGHVSKARAAAARLKRGGGRDAVLLEDGGETVAATTESPEETFHREWVREVVAAAVAALRDRCASGGHAADFEAFARYDLVEDPEERPTYAQVASALGLPVTQVTNGLHRARRDFRIALLATLRERTVTEEEFEAEARALLGEAWRGR